MNNIKSSKIELLNNRFELFGSYEILDIEKDLNLTDKTLFKVTVDKRIYLNENWYIRIGNMYGRIIEASQKDEVFIWTIAINSDMFDHEIVIDELEHDRIEYFLMEQIYLFFKRGFLSSDLNVSFDVLSETSGMIPTDINNLSDLLSTVKRLYNIEVNVSGSLDDINISIEKKNQRIMSVFWNERDLITYVPNFTLDLPTMVTIFSRHGEINYYLCEDGLVRDAQEIITSGIKSLPITKNKIEKMESSNAEEIRLKAEEILLAGESNEIEIEYLQHSTYVSKENGKEYKNYIDVYKLLNTIVTFYMPFGTDIRKVVTRITKVEIKNDSKVLKITLGASRRRMNYYKLKKDLTKKGVIN